jgi:fructosamine-3-kinase
MRFFRAAVCALFVIKLLARVEENKKSISQNLLAEIVAHLKMPLSNVTPMARRGLSNAIFEAKSPAGKVVIKVAGIGELGVHRKEARAAELAIEHGVRAPAVLAVGNTEGYSFIVTPFIPGKDVDTLPEAQRIPHWQEVGRQIAKLHQIGLAGFTDDFEEGVLSAHDATLRLWLDYAVDVCATPAARSILGADRSARLAPAFHRLSKAKLKPVVSYGGLQPGNLRVDALGGVWLLDWGDAIGHSPLRDIADLFVFNVSQNERNAFYKGYGGEFSPDETELRLMIVIRLAMRAIWLAERRNKFPEVATLLNETLQRLEQYL